jgi:6-phosphogluconate dehydrogenase
VDAVIKDLLPHLEPDDILIDGGNSHFTDTERREAFLSEQELNLSASEFPAAKKARDTARASCQGGKREVYEHVRAILEAASATVNGEPCVAYMGKSSAGHFVKMVHNGIEYGLMQILAETYDFMSRVLQMNYPAMSETFAHWNNSELNSFLVEISSEVLRKIDDETGKPLVEMVLDKAGQRDRKMDFAGGDGFRRADSDNRFRVSMRQISAQKEARVLIAQKYGSQLAQVSENIAESGETVVSEPSHETESLSAKDTFETPASEFQKRKLKNKPDSISCIHTKTLRMKAKIPNCRKNRHRIFLNLSRS